MDDSNRKWALFWHHWFGVMVRLMLSGLLLGGNARATEFDEYAIKAAYLYNFAKYVEWPPEIFVGDDASLLICIAGKNPFGGALEMLAGKMVGSHPVEIRYALATANLSQCHVVFIAHTERSRLNTILSNIDSKSVLTVSDIANFTEAGGMIGLIEIEQRIRFDINMVATDRARLKLSSQLLKLARIVLGSSRVN